MTKSGFRQFTLFTFFAGMAALVNIISRYYFSVLAMNFTFAVTLAYFLGMSVNYTLNKYLTFPKGPRRSVHELRTFFMIAFGGLLLTNIIAIAIVFLLMHIISLAGQRQLIETVAHITAVGITAIYSFFGHKYFTFQNGIRIGLRRLF